MEKQNTAKKTGKSAFQQEVLQRVKQLRIKHHLNQPQLAEILDVTNGQIGHIESCNQKHKYSLPQLAILCKEFGVTINFIFTGKDTCPQDELINAIVKYEAGK